MSKIAADLDAPGARPARRGRPARIPGLDPLRAIAALAVLVGHGFAVSGRPVPLTARTLGDWLLALTPTGVWMFFALSGFVIARPYVEALLAGGPGPSLRGYAARRALRIFPLYLLCAAVVIALLDRLGPRRLDMAAHVLLLHNLVPGRQQAFIQVSWTLSLEVLFYAAVPVLAWLLARRARTGWDPERLARAVVASAVASAAVTLAAALLAGGHPDASLYVRQSLAGMWSAFCPGLLVAVWWADTRPDPVGGVLGLVRRASADGRVWWASLFGAFAVAGTLTWVPDTASPALVATALDLGRMGWSLVYGLVVLRVVTGRLLGVAPRPLVALGRWSYGIYLIHGTALVVLVERYPDLIPLRGRDGPASPLASIALLLAITVPLAAIGWRLVERPAIALGRRLGATGSRVDPGAAAVATPAGGQGAL